MKTNDRINIYDLVGTKTTKNNVGITDDEQRIGISGRIRAWITDNKTGKKRLVFEEKNAIQAAYAIKIVDALQTPTDYAFDTMFDGYTTAPPNGEDGIAFHETGGLWYEMLMAANVVANDQVTFIGTFTGVGLTVDNLNLGHDYAAPFNTIIAVPTGWANQAILNTETLTIEWIISHEVS